MSQTPPQWIVRTFGIEDYEPLFRRMKSFTLERGSSTPDELWLLQHKPVFTLGQAGRHEHILDAHDIPVVRVDRGGQVTYHGPGQLVAYLMVDIRRGRKGIRQLVDAIELSVIGVLSSYGVEAAARKDAPGVYVDGKKIAALGLRIKQGCSYHGLSFNIDMDLTPFTYINPCGYEGLQTTQLRDLLVKPGENLFNEARDRLVGELCANLGAVSV